MTNKIKLRKVLKDVQGLKIRHILEKGKCTGIIGLYNGKNVLEEYKANDQGMKKAINDAEGLVKRKYSKKHLIRKLPSGRLISLEEHKPKDPKKEAGRVAYLKRVNKKK